MANGNYVLKKHVFEGIRDFSPKQTFECGQCFRWIREDDGSYSGVVYGCFANVSYNNEEDTVIVWSNYRPDSETLRESFWRNYLDLDRDYIAIKENLAKNDAVMEDAIEKGSGIHILNQEPWEVLISFLISQNSNIPRISSSIDSLCKEFGEVVCKFEGKVFYAFPTIKKLSSLFESDLAVCKLGYRTKYLVETARQIDIDGGALLSSGKSIETRKIENYLLSLSGVGPKVAHCIMLFSMKKTEMFPIDVWMRRVMNRLYGIEENDIAKMQRYAREHFGEYGGIAQQYLFNYIRAINISIPTDPLITDFEEEKPAYLKYLKEYDEEDPCYSEDIEEIIEDEDDEEIEPEPQGDQKIVITQGLIVEANHDDEVFDLSHIDALDDTYYPEDEKK